MSAMRRGPQQDSSLTGVRDARLKAVMEAGFATHGKRTREEEGGSKPSDYYKWFGVEFVPFPAPPNVFTDDFRVPILIIPDFYVIAHVSSNGDNYKSIFKSIDREAGVGKSYEGVFSPRTPGWQTDVWTNAQSLASPVNIGGGDSSDVTVALMYTANLPMTRPPYPHGGEDDFNSSMNRREKLAQDDHHKMQQFYEQFFVFPRTGEKFVLIELYRNGIYIAMGACKYKVQPDGTSDGNVETDPLVAAEKLMDACPWV